MAAISNEDQQRVTFGGYTATKHPPAPDSFEPWRRLREINLPFRCAKADKGKI